MAVEIEVELPPDIDLIQAEARIEAACLAEGLRITLKSSLGKYPGYVHWHFKRGIQSGTLELTLWPQKRRLWFVHRAGRRAAWLAEAIASLSEALPDVLNPTSA